MNAMFQTTVEPSANLLKVSFSGRVDAAEAAQCAEMVGRSLGQLRPGFSLLTDLSSLESMGLECVPHIEQVMDRCNAAGIKNVVRIIPDPHKDIGLKILSLFHYRRGVRIITCQTAEEAQRVLPG